MVILALLFMLELCYFKIAKQLNFIDKPNLRSSHTQIVLRGGGIIFLAGIWIWAVVYGVAYPWALAGVTLAAAISFMDDVHSLPNMPRFLVQLVAAVLMMMDMDILHVETAGMAAFVLLVIVSVANFYNFMDGINGITGGYSVAVLIPMLYLNHSLHFIAEGYLEVSLTAVLVFCFFNFRKKAKCFAGDVGAVGIAFIILFALWRLVLTTHDLTYLLFLAVYGVDAILTIGHRILLKENLGEAHRKHAYQIMANELKIPHPIVSAFYTVLQLAISIGLISMEQHWPYCMFVIIGLTILYLVFMKRYYHLHQEYLLSIKKHEP